jgi:hypothetical protein
LKIPLPFEEAVKAALEVKPKPQPDRGPARKKKRKKT